MRTRLIVVAMLAWFVLLAICFAHFQFAGYLKASPFGDDLASAAEVLAIAAVAAGLGLRILPRRQIDPAAIVARLAAGLAALGIASFILCSAGLLRAYVVWPMLAGLGLLSYREIARTWAWLTRIRLPRLGAAGFAVVAVAAFAAVVLLVNCLAPLTANDALVYHLNLPKIYTQAGGLVRLPYNVYANMPHYGEMLYTLVFCVSGETGAKLFYFLLVLAAAAAIYALARSFAGRRFAALGSLCFLAQPLVLDVRVVCNVDIPLALFFIAAVILLAERRAEGTSAQPAAPVIAAGALAGFMTGIKYTAIAPALSLLVLPLLAFRGRIRARTLAVAVLVAAAVFAPWLVKNQAYVGNPVYPVFAGSLDGSNWDSVQERELLSWQESMGMGRTALDYALLPFNVNVRGKPEMGYGRFDGTMAPVLLLLVPLAFVRRTRFTLALIIMMLGISIFWAWTSQQMRFLLPAIALAAVLAAAGSAWLNSRAGSGAGNAIVLLAALLLAFSFVVPDQYGRASVSGATSERLGVDFGLESRTDYLHRNLQPLDLFDYVRRSLPRGEPVFMIWENRAYYLDNPYFADSFFEASSVMRMVARASDPGDLAWTIQRMGFKHVIVNEWLGEHFSRTYQAGDVAKLKAFIDQQLESRYSANRLTLYSFRAD
jgi:hypothetical protein